MSLHAQDQVWQHSAAKGYDRLVLLAIANFANDWGFADPAIPTISHHAKVSVRQVQYCLHRLVHLGELAVSPGRGSHPTVGGRQKTHLYQILVGDLKGGAQPAPPSGGVHGAPPRGARKRLSTGSSTGNAPRPVSISKGVHGAHQGGAPACTTLPQRGCTYVHPNLVLSTTQYVEPNALPLPALISQLARNKGMPPCIGPPTEDRRGTSVWPAADQIGARVVTKAVLQPGPAALDRVAALDELRLRIRGAHPDYGVRDLEAAVCRAILGLGEHGELWHSLRDHITVPEQPDDDSALVRDLGGVIA